MKPFTLPSCMTSQPRFQAQGLQAQGDAIVARRALVGDLDEPPSP